MTPKPGSDLLNRSLYCERKHLIQCADRFANAMKARLLEMMFKGYRGWDNRSFSPNFRTMLIQYAQEVCEGKLSEVDTANVAMILWNLREKEKNKGKRRIK